MFAREFVSAIKLDISINYPVLTGLSPCGVMSCCSEETK
jgi:hypothetical protein